MDELLTMDLVKYLANEVAAERTGLVKLLTLFVSGNWTDFTRFANENVSVFQSNGS